MKFLPNSPVFFYRHTLSLKDGCLSLFTLDGRLKFQLEVSAQVEETLANGKLKEIVMFQDAKVYVLRLVVGEGEPGKAPPALEAPELRVVTREEDAA
jgi:hypothetical protein